MMAWPFSKRLRAEDDGPPTPGSRDPASAFWYDEAPRLTWSGQNVTIETARGLPVVRDCLQVLCQTVACLDYGFFRIMPDGSVAPFPDHPMMKVLKTPNSRDTSYDFFFNLVDDLASAGKFLALRGADDTLWRIAPKDYSVEILADRTRRFKVREPGQAEKKYLDEEVWFIPLPPSKSDSTGRSPILDDGREAIGAALAVQTYGAQFFANDARTPFVFTYKSFFKDLASKANFLSAWSGWVTGANRHKPAVLEHDIGIKELAGPNDAAQFLETRKENTLDVTRLWRMQPHKVGLMDATHFKNIEHQSIEFVTDTIGPILELVEASVEKWFLDDDPEIYFEFNIATLLRGDMATRYAAYAIARQWGWLSVNDILKIEGRNGIGPDGDRYIEPLNMQPAGQSAPPATEPDDPGEADAA